MARPRDDLAPFILLGLASNRECFRKVVALPRRYRAKLLPNLERVVGVLEWASDCLRGEHRTRKRVRSQSQDWVKRHDSAFRGLSRALGDTASTAKLDRLVPLQYPGQSAALWCKAGSLTLAVMAFCAAERARMRRLAPSGVLSAGDAIDRELASRYRTSLWRPLLEKGLS